MDNLRKSRVAILFSHVVLGEFHRYFWAGSLAFLTDLGILFILTDFVQVNYLISNLFGFAGGLTVSYLLAIKWVFRYRSLGNVYLELVLFTLFAALSLLVNEFALWFFVEHLSIYYVYSKMIAAIITFAFNFTVKKIFLFTEKTKPIKLSISSQNAVK